MQECFVDKTKSSSATSLMSLSLVHYQQQRRNYNRQINMQITRSEIFDMI